MTTTTNHLSSARAKGPWEVLVCLCRHYGPQRKPQNDVGWMDRFMFWQYRVEEWLEHPPLWARVAFFVSVAFVVWFDVVAVMILWPGR